MDDGVRDLVQAARGGSRRALGRLLSMAERVATDPVAAAALDGDLAAAATSPPSVADTRVIGLTGPPGVGKSSLAAALATALAAADRLVVVLAVDPSSPVTGGALLGDRVRFVAAESSPGADDGRVVVRSMASRGHAGGLSVAVPLAVAVARAVGIHDVIVETVGSGQGEIAVTELAETTVLVVAPGLGDEIQALKAGIAELADVICVTKADLPGAGEAARHWRQAAAQPKQLAAGAAVPWQVRVVTARGRDGEVADLLAEIDRHGEWFAAHGSAAATDSPRLVLAAETEWGAAATAADSGNLTATLVLLGRAIAAHARQRAGPGVPDDRLLADAGMAGIVTPGDLDPARLATRRGLARLVADVRARATAVMGHQ